MFGIVGKNKQYNMIIDTFTFKKNEYRNKNIQESWPKPISANRKVLQLPQIWIFDKTEKLSLKY